ncbi:MAG: V4R domain-containing protein [Gemmatimonadales bacterium]
MSTVLSVPRLTVGRATINQLRQVLERAFPPRRLSWFGSVVLGRRRWPTTALPDWCSTRYGVESPQGLDSRYLSEALGGFFRDDGWGTASTEIVAPGILAFDTPDWFEAEPRDADYPCCHFSAGMLSDFFTRLSGQAAAVLEVECRATGQARCRYLVGSPEMLTWVYEGGRADGASHGEMISRARPSGAGVEARRGGLSPTPSSFSGSPRLPAAARAAPSRPPAPSRPAPAAG